MLWPEDAFEEPPESLLLPPTAEELAALVPPPPTADEAAGVNPDSLSSAPSAPQQSASSAAPGSAASGSHAASAQVKELPKEEQQEAQLDYDRRAFDKVKQRLFYKHLADTDQGMKTGIRRLTSLGPPRGDHEC